MPQHSPNSLELRRQLRQLLLDGLCHPLHHRRHRGRRGGGVAAARRDAKGTPCNATADNLAVRLGPPVLPDKCTAPCRVLVTSLHYCSLHGWAARMQGNNGELSAAAAHASDQGTSCRTQSPTYSSETPPYTPTPLEPPGFELPRTMAARRGALPFYNNGVSSSMAAQVVFDEPTLSPPPQPLAPAVVDELGIVEPAMPPHSHLCAAPSLVPLAPARGRGRRGRSW
ncbi:hypothetical protein PVAP13_1NG276719 [Panicum virgatum]|uniref:Uncharacterized protein n=1 Tax=Panicum virgatum TaxID=38727 RepID=A0A8T0WWW4_PANVG|nr:hypothetical protein PVAP13_1NG276719 [Panicum virgatum]